jgi:hypothetical protein
MKNNLTTPMIIVAAIGVVSMILLCVTAGIAILYGAGASAMAANLAMLLFGALSSTMTGAFSSLYTLIKEEIGITPVQPPAPSP